jgi:hypothetical protein
VPGRGYLPIGNYASQPVNQSVQDITGYIYQENAFYYQIYENKGTAFEIPWLRYLF